MPGARSFFIARLSPLSWLMGGKAEPTTISYEGPLFPPILPAALYSLPGLLCSTTTCGVRIWCRSGLIERFWR